MPAGDIGAKPGKTPGLKVDSPSQVLVSACGGVVEDMSGTVDKVTSRPSGDLLGSYEDSWALALRFDISVSLERFLW